MEGKINLNISDGEAFFAHQASINFSPTQIFLDYKNITPRMDERNRNGPTLAVKHNLVMLDPHHALVFRDLLTKVLKDYEKQFGKIKMPEALKKAESKQKKAGKKSKDEVPHYLG